MYMQHITLSEYIKEYVDNMNHYIQWIMYEPCIEKSGEFPSNISCGFFVVSKVFTYLAIQNKDMEDIKTHTDRASMYFIEFYKEFGIFPGMFEFTNFDTSMFILDKTITNDMGMIDYVEEDTTNVYEVLTIISKKYEGALKHIVESQISTNGTIPHTGVSMDMNEALTVPPTVKGIVDSVNQTILPVMRDVIQFSMDHADDETLEYMRKLK
jgi:hypothetical protein